MDSLLTSYGISSVVTFSTRIQKESRTLIDNIFLNTSKFKNFTVNPSINGLSDHDAQCINIHDIFKHKPSTNAFSYRKFDQTSITDFNNRLSYELWINVFNENDVNICFNNFLNTYLKLFNTCFPLSKAQFKHDNNAWLSKGVKISCCNKRKLYKLQRDNNDPTLTTYCKTLTKVIKLAKQKYYNSLISCSSNKNKTIWNIINSSTNKKPSDQNITEICAEGKTTHNVKIIADSFNKHFVSIARDMLSTELKADMPSNHTDSLHYLTRTCNQPFPPINIKYVSTKEVEKITKTLKIKKISWIR